MTHRILPTDHFSEDEADRNERKWNEKEERVGALHQDQSLVVADGLRSKKQK